ncbi:MAG TPA: 6-phosphogluconolactonase [Myxococcaceae bacterium]|nr:6-phosphogluconolactonase [Myxococcaceae bacterium]
MDTAELTFEVHPTETVLNRAATQIAERLRERLMAAPRASLALSGGQSTVGLCEALASRTLDWGRVDLFQVDERAVPPEHEESNARLLQVHLIDALGERAPTFHRMQGERDDLEAAAADYAQQLPKRLDVVVLGVGPDGHTASLFPDSPLLEEQERRVAVVTDSPKPPPRRLTLTFPVLRAADAVFGVALGGGKREVMQALRQGVALPAARVRPAHWFLDPAAAGEG